MVGVEKSDVADAEDPRRTEAESVMSGVSL